jgi:hypothetical protein
VAAVAKDRKDGLHVVGGEENDADDAAVDAMNATPDADGRSDDERSIEELAEEPAEEKPVSPTQLALEGTRDKIPLGTGGRRAEESEIRLMGGRRPIIGAFDKGAKLLLVVESSVRAVEDIDVDDEWGNVSKTIRVHKARQTYVRVATPELLARKLLDQMSLIEAKALLEELAG